jgi:CRP-like cAMP-binding protein
MPVLGTNLLLDSLSAENRDLLISRSNAIELPLRTMLCRPEEPPRYAYFMTSGVASVVTVMEDGGAAEVNMIGAEGLVGSLQLLGPATAPTQCFMQLEGGAYRIPVVELRRAFEELREIRERILEFAQEQALSLGQIAGCHRLHDSEERLARWLLMVQDRSTEKVLGLTQEFLAEMLGSRRTTVTIAAGILQRSGLIEYNRGRVRILDREKLEEAACGCYQIVKTLQKNLYTRPS